ncbi:MAG: SCP2 sterol-binding domain-containing protein [Actinobacteria bacterium]|nr:SCP2 sterol-binding domain-containing protein [Actinomycetota bacterium]MCA1720189.1 SCP2 sterol-binding domain-containing protein [Actinomycetota bacterium]
MATLQECQDAIAGLTEKLAEVDPETRRKYAVERTVSCRVPDLDVIFLARVDDDGTIQDFEVVEHGKGQVKLTATSDDLIALIEGRLNLPVAWATGKLKIDASMLDLLKLRSLL